MITYENFVKKFIGITIVILLVIAGFNFVIDPAGIFTNKKVDLAVKYLINGKAVTGLTNFDERIFKKKLILQAKEKAETIILGSSRSMGIIAEFDEDNNIFGNFSVSGANFNDAIALLYTYYEHNNNLPQKVVIAVEPFDLNKNRGDTRWKSLEREYYAGLNLIGIQTKEFAEKSKLEYNIEKLKTLLSISYLRNSIKSFYNDEEMPIGINVNFNHKNDIVLPDGSLKYGQKVEEMSTNDIEKCAKSYINTGQIYQLENFKKLDEFDKDKLVALIKFFKYNNVEIILWFPPYHPLVYDYFKKNPKYKMVLEAEKYFMNIAKKENLKIFGSYNPEKCGVEERDFSDSRHLRTSGYEKIFKNKF